MPEDPSPDASCPQCGGPLDASLEAGSCAACLWGDLIAGEQEEAAALKDAPKVAGYQIIDELGRGGMGVVYLAQQEKPRRKVALKMVAPYSLRAKQERLRFLVEIEAMASVNHASILPLYEAGEDVHGRPWFTMQLAGGGTLGERVAMYRGDWRKSAGLIATLAQAIQYAHERGILHRDLKPANVLFDDRENPFIADFGLAKWAESDTHITESAQMVGSPAYLAPEAAAGGAAATTTASDVYGLGTIFYELLTGHKPYKGASSAQVLAQIIAKPPPNPRQVVSAIPRDLEVITLKAIHREPHKRYSSAAAFAADLTLWLEGKPITARPVSNAERAYIWAKRNPALAGLSGVLAASLTIGGFLLWKANQRLGVSLKESDANFAYLTRSLPPSLARVGRLDLLDGVFTHVATHYENRNRSDSESLAMEADFLNQWAQILRPRGEILPAIERLKQAVNKARQATAGAYPSLAAIRARLDASWRLGEAFIENRQFPEAEEELTEAAALAARFFATDVSIRALDAQIALELAFIPHRQNNHEETIKRARIAWEKWRPLLPILEKPPMEERYQSALAEALKTPLVIAETEAALAKKGGDKAAEHSKASQEFYQEHFDMTQRLAKAAPSNTEFQMRLAGAHIAKSKRDGMEKAELRFHLTAAEEISRALMHRDPGNLRFLGQATLTAADLAAFGRDYGDPEGHKEWREVFSKRMLEHYQHYTTEVSFLNQRGSGAALCACLFEEDDWATSRKHFEACLTTMRQGLTLPNTKLTPETIANRTDWLYQKIEQRENAAAADEWRSSLPK